MPTPDISDYNELFLRTAKDHVKALEELVLKLEATGPTPKITEEIFRQAHSLKGSSSVMGFKKITDLCTQIDQTIHPGDGKDRFEKKQTAEISRCIVEIKNILENSTTYTNT
ncbi:MAG: Hpt domain-containing protein [Candidatus Levybacteria bacterium]|nr:Hpt domain-containing protein [Candidatus Levybacteria bacterium]